MAFQEQQGPDILRPQTRGMQGGNFQNSKLDGMTMFITVATAMEQFQQIEVVNGLSASLYGPANPSGMFNFVSKRPTDYDLRELTASYVQRQHRHGEGGPWRPHRQERHLCFRLNALYGSGDGYVDGSHQRRALGDLGIDVRPWQHGVIELNYSDYSLTNKGYPGWFTYGQKIDLPPAPDPTRVGYGQSYAGVDMRTKHRQRPPQAGLRLRLAPGRGRPQPGRGAQHQYAGQQSDHQRRGLHVLVRQRLCAALRHHQRRRLPQRDASRPGVWAMT